MITKLSRVLLVVLFTGLLFAKEETVKLNINDMEIEEFIKMVAKIDNKNILIPLSVRGKINYISKKPIPKKNIFHLLQMILKDKGFTLINSGKGYYIVSRISDAHKDSPDIKDVTTEEIIHTTFIKVKNLDATSLSGTVKNFLSRSGKLLVSKETNSLIITDLPDNINIVRELVKRLDVRVRLETKFVELENAQVADVYTQIKSIADIVIDNKIETEKISIFKHETSNTLTFVGPNKSIQKLLPYVKRFDESDNMTDQNIYFVKLNNAEASEVLSILNQVIGKRVYDKGQEKPSVTVDKELNALIVISSEKEYKEFLELIAKLDVERKQVYVKARIVEISESKTRDIGFKYGLEGFALNEGGLYTLASTLNGGSSFVASSVASGIGLPSGITEGFGLGVSLAFLGKKSAANTLSEPSILCINNQESSIYVGQTQSIQSGTTVTSGGNTQNSYTREDIGLTLKIKPRISNDSKVILNVDATLEDVVAGSGEGSPTTTKREVKTVAVVKNGGSVIVGGLIKNKVDEAESKIPFLGDIPILGYLFKNKYYLKDKVHLVIMLTPYIVEKSEDLEELRNSLKTLSELERKVVNKFISEKMMDEDDIRIESVEPRSDIDFDD